MSSVYADEGTIAHALAALCLREGTDATAYVGRIIEAQDYPHATLAPSAAHRWMVCPGSVVLETAQPFVPRTFTWEVTEDMADDVQVYLDNVRRYLASAVTWWVEREVDLSHVLGTGPNGERQGGTADLIVLTRDGELQVHDLKFGRGVEVEAEGNEQMQLYALGALRLVELAADVRRVRMVIHQPRVVRAPKEWDIAVDELLAFAQRATEAARLARTLTPTNVEDHLVPGDKQCRFCAARATCPALRRYVSEQVYSYADAFGSPELVEPRPVPTDSKQLGVCLDRVDLIEAWCRAIRAKAEEYLRAGLPVVGAKGAYKLVAGKKGARQWRDETEVENELKRMRLPQDIIYNRKLKTPPQLEKIFKEQPRRWEKLQAYIVQKDGAPHVAPADDPRPAIATVADQFEDLTKIA